MTTIDDKIRLFSRIVYEKIQSEQLKKFDEFEAEKGRKISEIKKEIAEKREFEIRETTKKTRAKAVELVSKEKVMSQQEELKLKDKMMEEILTGVTSHIDTYVQGERYKKALFKAVISAVVSQEKNSYTIYLTKRDHGAFGEELRKMVESENKIVTIKVAVDDILGGFLLEDGEKKFRIDNSLRNKLEDIKPFIGLRIKEGLDWEARSSYNGNL